MSTIGDFVSIWWKTKRSIYEIERHIYDYPNWTLVASPLWNNLMDMAGGQVEERVIADIGRELFCARPGGGKWRDLT